MSQQLPRLGGPPAACRTAMATLAGGRAASGDRAWSAALAHAAACPACADRLGLLAAAVASSSPNELPCAECQARLPAYLARGAGPEAPAFRLVAEHLALCGRCRTVAGWLGPAVAGDWSTLPEPASYPRFDTSFLSPGVAELAAGRWAAWRARWRRRLHPAPGRRSESPASAGLLGLAALLVLLLAGLAAGWALFRPELPLRPSAPRPATATRGPSPTATATATATPTPATAPPGRSGIVPSALPARPSPLPAGLGGAETATAAPPEETRERPPRTVPPTPGPTQGPAESPPPYPGPTEATAGPTDDPYPPPATEPAGTETPGTS